MTHSCNISIKIWINWAIHDLKFGSPNMAIYDIDKALRCLRGGCIDGKD